jgi:hypothetical protein
VTEREAPPDWGFDHRQADPYDDDGWFGGDHVAEPTFVDDPPTPPHGEPAVHAKEAYVTPREVAPAPPTPTRRSSTSTVNTWTVNGQLRASDTSTLTFRAPPEPWYHAKHARIALIAVVAAAAVVPIALLAWPDSSPTNPAPATSVAPPPTTTQPALSSAPPTPINLPPPPPPPAPPPPPPDTGTAPTYDQPYWTPSAPEPTKKPDVDVTRAPISVAPVPRQPTGTNSANPGDGRKGFHCGGWC